MPMFPLGTVLVPGAGLPLHVFEERYRAMVRDCLSGDQEFGVVLIERGSEVGGGDVRSSVGTVARIVEASELPDGRWAMIAVGTRRIRVVSWLPDDPYPRAEVEAWPDAPAGADHAALLDDVVGLLRRALALAAEAGDDAPAATFELVPDPVLAGYQTVALAPLGALDRQGLLTATTPEDRLHRLRSLLEEEIAVLQLRLGGP
jgi:Lon protease-like protein